MSWVLALIALIASAFVFLVTALLAGMIVPPLYNEVVNSQEVVALGYDRGAEVAVRIGLKYVLPLLALVLVVWFVLLKLRKDDFKGQVNSRGRR